MTLPPIPEALKAYPRLGQWLDVGDDGRIRARSGKVEIGQGIAHALRLIVAEELGLGPGQVHMVKATTAESPDEAVTSGSLSIQHSGAALRYAAAHLREACRARWAARARVALESVTLEGGMFLAGAERASYADLVDSPLLQQPVDTLALAERGARPSGLAHIGRDDVGLKVFGEFEFIQDLVLPRMAYGAVFRPRTLDAQVDEAVWEKLARQLADIPGVTKIVRDGVLLGAIADAEHVLDKVARRVDAVQLWRERADVPQPHGIGQWLRSQPLDTTVILDRSASAVSAASTFRGEYGRAWLQHASIGLCCAIAEWRGSELQVWSHTQGIFNLRRDLALAFGVPTDAVTVCHAEGAGCYGHNGADDVAFDAAWLARHTGGRPLRVQWNRRQEMANSPMGCAMVVSVEAGVDDEGRLVTWKQQVWSQGHGTRPGRGQTPALLGAWQTADPAPPTMAVNQPPNTGGGSDRNAVPPYDVPQALVLNHRVMAMPLRVSALRSLGAHVNVLAAESMMDEVAAKLGRDPLEYRLSHLRDERAIAVLREVARLAGWGQPAAHVEGAGRGLGFARYKNTGAYCAVVADLVVDTQVRLTRLTIAADVGLVVHPDGAKNQIEGGAIQAASWTLRETANVTAQGIASGDWATYPILGFGDVCPVEVSLLDRPDLPSLGAGECSAGPTAAAIANAIHAALGIRMRTMPFTADALMAAAQR